MIHFKKEGNYLTQNVLFYSTIFLGLILAIVFGFNSALAEVDHSAHEGMGGMKNVESLPTSTDFIKNFKYRSSLMTMDHKYKIPEDGLYEVVIPLKHMIKFHAGDIKVVDQDGVEIPFLMLDGERVIPWHSIFATYKRNFQTDGSLITIVDVGDEGMWHHGINLQMPANAHTTQKIEIFGSDIILPINSPKWQENILQDNGRIFAYIDKDSSQQVFENYVSYKQTKSRYLKVVASPVRVFKDNSGAIREEGDNTGDIRGLLKVEPFNILGALIQTVPTRYANRDVRLMSIEAKDVNIKKMPKFSKEKIKIGDNMKNEAEDLDLLRSKMFTEINIDLGMPNTYTHEFELYLYQDQNKEQNWPQFIRYYKLEKSNDKRNWSLASEGQIYNIENESVQARNMKINYSETRDRYFRLKIYNDIANFSGDLIDKNINNEDKSNKVFPEELSFEKRVTFSHFQRSLIFKAEKDKNYNLYFGNTALVKTTYDSKLLRSYATATPESIKLLMTGDLQKNPEYSGKELFQDEWFEVENKLKWSLFGLMILLVGGLHVYQVKKKVK